MIDPALVETVRGLLAGGKLSQRKIAKLTGVSRGTVGAIANGTRRDYPPRQPAEDELLRPTGPPQYCGHCGAVVYMPCRACALRESMRAEGKRMNHRGPEPNVSTALRLNPEHHARYEELCRRRMKVEG
jgi:transposase InsO family protein